MRKITLLVTVLATLLFIAGCGKETSLEVPVPGNEDVEEMIVVEEPIVKEIKITAKRFEFIPDPIKVNKGDRVRLLISAIDTTHGFNIDAPFLSVNKRLPQGEVVVVEFTATETGSWTFRCSVPCGSGHGSMGGKLVVE